VQKQIAEWNTELKLWIKPTEALFSEHLELYSATWPTSGMTQNGKAFELPMQVLHTSDSGSLSLHTQDKRFGTPNTMDSLPPRYGEAYERVKNAGGRKNRLSSGNLREQVVHLLPVPDSALLRTPVASEAEGGAVAPDVAKANGQTLRLSGQMIDMVAPDQLPKLPTPTVSDQYTANLSSTQQKEGSMHSVTLAQVFHKPDLFPTPNTMEHREIKTPEQIAALKAKSPGGYRNLRETVVNELFPTPITSDYKNGKSSAGYGLNLPETARSLFPTPVASEGTKAPSQQTSATKSKTGQVWLSNVAKDLEPLLGTPRATAANSSSKQVELGAPKARLEDQVHTNWGKFEPAIRRWEAIIGRPAPEPTKPDGKEGNHRLSSKFTEWMMGLPDGWITDIGLKRNDELKACGNGVVPQQAELALSLLGIKEILER